MDDDAKALLDWLMLRKKYWRLPHKFIGRASRELKWPVLRVKAAKLYLFRSNLISEKQWSDKAFRAIESDTGYQLSTILLRAFIPRLTAQIFGAQA